MDIWVKRSTFLVILPLLLALVGCASSPPALLELEPAVYEDENVTIEYRIGYQVYYIRVSNKTGMEMFVDRSRASIVSFGGETRNLNLTARDTHIPPSSSLVLVSATETLFHTSIDAPFLDRRTRQSTRYNHMTERQWLRRFAGEAIRLYLPITIGNVERVYDINLSIQGIEE